MGEKNRGGTKMINRVVLVGRLTRDPELKMTNSGVNVATFSLAVNRTFTNNSGQREADFINCVVWRKQAENLARYCGKGSMIGIEGRVQTRSYEANDGSKRNVTEVVCDSVQFLESKAPQNASAPQQNEDPFKNMNDPFAQSSSINLTEDDLPF
jgi:single-strand DNA-binding protein